ncbi:glycoside hydrolase family 5 protein [Teratosphaeria destructans]|uniref:Glycoside hydrolase family 5 protein n=1 Tax=Teratosphaeria destructans TaxID=418781 RepID=A0A9W7T187_9PEZI|nr:glycoside hydrolase family 5 protein [Teratosphaeria destructans]
MRVSAPGSRSMAHAALLFSPTASAVTRGVNLGGWLVTEPWLTPSIFNSTGAVDEWHLCAALGPAKCLSTLQDHWSTFYTQSDFLAIQSAGLNAVRIPFGYWAIPDLVTNGEPYVAGQYPYLQDAVLWANALGLKVMIDVHGAPGSQNGWEETGLVGPVDFPTNSSNSDKTLSLLKNLTEEFTQSKYGGAVTNIELLNEPVYAIAQIKEFYSAGAKVVGPYNTSGINVTIHDGFYQPTYWKDYDPNNDSATEPGQFLTVDTHQFWAFPPLNDLTKTQTLEAICTFAQTLKEPVHGSNGSGIPYSLVGEWSLDTGITGNSTTNVDTDVDKRTWYRALFEAQNAAYTPNGEDQASIGWFFWAWKTEYDIDAWSYRKGLSDEYIPSNISDPSTYIFPVEDNGCINQNISYTASSSVPPNGWLYPTGTIAGFGDAADSTGTAGASSTSGGHSSSNTKSAAPTAYAAPSGFGLLGFWVILALAMGILTLA